MFSYLYSALLTPQDAVTFISMVGSVGRVQYLRYIFSNKGSLAAIIKYTSDKA